MLNSLTEIVLPAIVAATVVFISLPRFVKIAHIKKIVDNPNARRLNKEPVPVLGGVSVYLGIIMAIAISCGVVGIAFPPSIFAASLLLVYTGAVDDVFPVSARIKFILQIIAVALLVFVGGLSLDDFNGLWGIYELSPWASYPITFIALVGIINGFNLLDGVDGLSSGYSIIVALICGILFWFVGDTHIVILCFATIGALIPFFLQNVFGRKYKMFLGDAGSLMLGLLFAVIICHIVGRGVGGHIKGVISFLLAVFALPIFDTLRVMTARMMKGLSPFNPDKTHMHHLFIHMGYCHIGTTVRIIAINMIPVVVWAITEMIPSISINAQFYIILALCIVLNIGIYLGVNRWRNKKPAEYDAFKQRNAARAVRCKEKQKPIQRLLDKM